MSTATSKPWANLYGSKTWQCMRRAQLSDSPLCAYCLPHGRMTAATVVDHVQPHKGDKGLFYDPHNLQSLCKTCHDGAKKSEEMHGKSIGCNIAGQPNDPAHHWFGEGVGKS